MRCPNKLKLGLEKKNVLLKVLHVLLDILLLHVLLNVRLVVGPLLPEFLHSAFWQPDVDPLALIVVVLRVR